MTDKLPRAARLLLLIAPLALAVFPAWMAWHLTCPVPHADHWFCIGDPYVALSNGAPFWSVVHMQGNDSRLDVMRLIGFGIVWLTKWDLRAESLACVVLAIASASVLGWILRRHAPGSAIWTLLTGLLGIALVLTPHQWMNWTFGVQTCYMAVVLFTLLAVCCFELRLPLWSRTALAGLCALLATHSFLNGWLAWILGTLCLCRALWLEPGSRKAKSCVAGFWLLLFAFNLVIYFQGYNLGTQALVEEPLSARLAADPSDFLKFFLRVLSAPFSDLSHEPHRAERDAVNRFVSTRLSLAALALLLGVAWSLRKRRFWVEHGTRAWPCVLLLLLGLANACAVTLARTGMTASGPFESRYIAFTLWFHIGLLGLLGLMDGRLWRVTRWSWLGVLVLCFPICFAQGRRNGQRDFDRNQMMAAAAIMRHVAVEPTLLGPICPEAGAEVIPRLDQLDQLSLLRVPTLRTGSVSASPMAPPTSVKGRLAKGAIELDGVALQGWAMEADTHDMADAIAISYQAEGQEETWLGLAQRRLVESKLHENLRSRACEGRLGWFYKHGLKEKSVLPTQEIKNELKPKPIPAGKVTFRAYVLNVPSGTFAPLSGSVTLETK